MPKKSANTRSGASRNRPRPQKSVQLVRPTPAVSESALADDEVETGSSVATTTAAAEPVEVVEPIERAERNAGSRRRREAPKASATSPRVVEESGEERAEAAEVATGTTVEAPRSASARMAARRQAVQKAQTRRSENLITAEHYAYVRRDLVFIAILACMMLATLIVLHFVPGIGS
jgi:hypothetical protein